MNNILITAPTSDPVTPAEVKVQARIDTTEEDALIDGFIKSAVQRLEGPECWIQLITAVYELRIDDFPSSGEVIVIPKPPLTTIDSIIYTDSSGVEQTLATSVYTVNAKSIHEPDNAEVYLSFNQSWPSTRSIRDAVKVRYSCGFGDPEDVPSALKNWIMAAVAAMYKNREEMIAQPGMSLVLSLDFIDGLLDGYKTREFF